MTEPQPLSRFLQISDLHYTSDPARDPFSSGRERTQWLLAQVGEGGLGDIAFTLCVGDGIHGGSPEHAEADLGALTDLLREVDIPFFPVPGNHETQAQEGDPRYSAIFARGYGVAGCSYTHRQGELLFVMLDNSGSASCEAAVYARREQWLRATFDEFVDVPKILCCHVPLVPMRDPAVLADTLGIESWMTREPEILALVEQHADSVVAVLSGHLHLTGLVCRQSIFHITVAGIASYPSDYGLYSIYEDRIEFEAKQLPAELLDTTSDLHGAHRRGSDVVDDTHPTHAEYVMGTYDERRFAIPMKRPVG